MPLLTLLIASTTLLPGLWEYSSTLAGMSGQVERKCLSKAEIDGFLTNPSNKRYDCDYTSRVVGHGRVRLKGVCTNRKHAGQKIAVSMRGTYTPESIVLKGVAEAPIFGGFTVPVAATVRAHRVNGDCASSPTAAPVDKSPDTPSGA